MKYRTNWILFSFEKLYSGFELIIDITHKMHEINATYVCTHSNAIQPLFSSDIVNEQIITTYAIETVAIIRVQLPYAQYYCNHWINN